MKNTNHKMLDDINRGILEELQKNARLSTAEIGRRVGLSAPAVAERMAKMEEFGVIQGYHPSFDFDKLDLTIRAFILFKARNIERPELMKLIDSIPEIIEWYTVTGNYCILLKIVAATSERLANTIEQFEKFGETSTSLILSKGSKSSFIKRRG